MPVAPSSATVWGWEDSVWGTEYARSSRVGCAVHASIRLAQKTMLSIRNSHCQKCIDQCHCGKLRGNNCTSNIVLCMLVDERRTVAEVTFGRPDPLCFCDLRCRVMRHELSFRVTVQVPISRSRRLSSHPTHPLDASVMELSASFAL